MSKGKHCKFRARLLIVPEDGLRIEESEFWDDDLTPAEAGTRGTRGTRDWAAEHVLTCWQGEELQRRFGLENDKYYEVVFVGWMTGWYEEASQEWDADAEVQYFQSQEVTADFIYGNQLEPKDT